MSEKTTREYMKVSKEQIEQLKRSFIRIFSLPVARMTIRELQDALKGILQGNPEASKAIYESLLAGALKGDFEEETKDDLNSFIEKFTLQFCLAKDVNEFGEFMNSFSCDFLQQGNQLFFVNRMRRLDGQEYHFHSAPETNIRLAHMFISRLQDLKKSVSGVTLDQRLIDELSQIKSSIDSILS
jgi:hypothetical protein